MGSPNVLHGLTHRNHSMKTLIFIFLCAILSAGCNDKITSKLNAPRPPLVFSAERATNALTQITALITECTPRDAGTPNAESAARWLQNRLTTQGITATLDLFSAPTPLGDKQFVNVLATLPGKSDEWIVLLSHFDTKSGIGKSFQGANDSGSSSGLLLELAAMLHAAGSLKYNMLCGFMDGEECLLAYSDRDGFHGSKHLARQLKNKKTRIKAVILMDMVGDRNLTLFVPRNGTATLRLLALEAAQTIGHRSQVKLFDGSIFDDHQAFLDLGYPAVNLIDFEYGTRPGENDYWHTLEDTLDKLSVESLHTTGRLVTEMLNRLMQEH